MTDLFTPPTTVASVRFKFQKSDDDKVYDFIVPHDMELVIGDKAVVATKRGETTVEIVAVNVVSDKATATIIRRVEPEPDGVEPAGEMDF